MVHIDFLFIKSSRFFSVDCSHSIGWYFEWGICKGQGGHPWSIQTHNMGAITWVIMTILLAHGVSIRSSGTSVVTFIAPCAVMMLWKSFFAFPISSRDRSFKQYLAWDERLLSFNILKCSSWMSAVLHYGVHVWFFLQYFSCMMMMMWKDRIPICWLSCVSFSLLCISRTLV